MYHGLPGKHRRMVRLYGEFLGPGDVGFDVGAHVGNRVRAWRALGARVVAVEPQPDFVRLLRLLFGRDRRRDDRGEGARRQAGTARMGISTATPTVSSLAPGWIETVGDRPAASPRCAGTVRRGGRDDAGRPDRRARRAGLLQDRRRGLRGRRAARAHPAPARAVVRVPADGARRRARGTGPRGAKLATTATTTPRSRPCAGRAIAGWTRPSSSRCCERYRPMGRSGDVYARLAHEDRVV